MKIPYYFGITIMLLLANIPNSYSSYIDTNLVEQIKPNLMARSKPTFSYTKFAAVSFLKSDSTVEFKGTLDVKSQCGALGYVIQKSKCIGDMKPSRLCSDDPSMASVAGAGDYTTGCCDSKIYTVTENAECPNNAAKLSNDSCYWGGEKKYRCACDRGRYQYSSIKGEWCGTIKGTNIIDYTRFNANLACSAYEPRTKKDELYFISCCPESYSKCNANNHEVGRGNECRVITNIVTRTIEPRYEECICASHYDTECPSDRVINGSLKCIDKNNRIWTPESNCESACTKTIETNIDSYLYKSSWHCLYRKDGAIVRDDEDTGGTCGVFDSLTAQGSYDECVAQGFNKSVDDCYDADVMLRCPNDMSKVWCLDGKYCTGYNIGGSMSRKLSKNDSNNQELSVCEPNKSMTGYDRNTEGSNAAKVDFCPSSDQGIRCRYKYDAPSGMSDCNKCWNDGVYTPGAVGCLVTDAENIREVGMGSKCCNDGYYMYQGVCQRNTCDRTKYPYDIRPPYDAGDVEECREGDPTAALGYRAYFGYKNCKTDPTKGEMWMYDPANNRRCVCARNGEGGRDYYLPFSVAQYYATNGDTSNNYANVGFNAGGYGEYLSCTDADGSYYGYTMCYLGRYMGSTAGVNKGMCLVEGPSGYTVTYPYGVYIGVDSAFLSPNGLPTLNIRTTPKRTEDAYCVNKYTHCQAKDGTQLGDSDVCALVPEGCNLGIESACNRCYHKVSVKKGGDGLYHLNDYTIMINSCRNDTTYQGFDKCPAGFKKGKGGYNNCYKDCYTSDPSKCTYSDVLKENGKVIGVVYYNSGSYLRIASTAVKYANWYDAKEWAANYAPAGFESDSRFGPGKWFMPPSGIASYGAHYFYFGTCAAEGFSYTSSTWTTSEIEDSAYRANYGGSSTTHLKTDKNNVFADTVWTYR